MLKTILLSIVLLSCTGAGRSISLLRKRRCECLSELMAGMRVLRLRMLNSMEPIGVLLRKSDCKLFHTLGNALWEGGGLNECWLQLRNQVRQGILLANLSDDDLSILDSFFAKLGKSGREEQNELFTLVIGEMEEAHHSARLRFAQASRTFTALGMLLGIAVCILII